MLLTGLDPSALHHIGCLPCRIRFTLPGAGKHVPRERAQAAALVQYYQPDACLDDLHLEGVWRWALQMDSAPFGTPCATGQPISHPDAGMA